MSLGHELLHELTQQSVCLVRLAKDKRRKVSLIVEPGSFTRHGHSLDIIADNHVVFY